MSTKKKTPPEKVPVKGKVILQPSVNKLEQEIRKLNRLATRLRQTLYPTKYRLVMNKKLGYKIPVALKKVPPQITGQALRDPVEDAWMFINNLKFHYQSLAEILRKKKKGQIASKYESSGLVVEDPDNDDIMEDDDDEFY